MRHLLLLVVALALGVCGEFNNPAAAPNAEEKRPAEPVKPGQLKAGVAKVDITSKKGEENRQAILTDLRLAQKQLK